MLTCFISQRLQMLPQLLHLHLGQLFTHVCAARCDVAVTLLLYTSTSVACELALSWVPVWDSGVWVSLGWYGSEKSTKISPGVSSVPTAAVDTE